MGLSHCQVAKALIEFRDLGDGNPRGLWLLSYCNGFSFSVGVSLQTAPMRPNDSHYWTRIQPAASTRASNLVGDSFLSGKTSSSWA